MSARVSAQRITLGTLPASVCVKSGLSVPVILSGAFQSDNAFKARIIWKYRGPVEVPTELRNGRLQIDLIPLEPSADDEDRGEFQVQIVSTKPAVESEPSALIVLRRPPALLELTADSGRVNPGQRAALNIRTIGSKPFDVFFSDSSQFQIDQDSRGPFQPRWDRMFLPVRRSGRLSVLRASNECGTDSTRLGVHLIASPVQAWVRAISPNELCQGGPISILYWMEEKKLEPANRFFIRLQPVWPTSAPVSFYEFPAVVESARLSGILPKDIPPGEYSIHIVTTHPATISTAYSRIVRLFEAPQVEFLSASETIDFGQSLRLNLRVSGGESYRVQLSDGSTLQRSPFTTNPFSLVVTPTRSTVYRVTSFETACKAPVVGPPVELPVTVRPGFRLDSLLDAQFCEGRTVRYTFTSNPMPLPQSTVELVLRTTYPPLRTYPVSATVSGNQLAFVVPALDLPTNHPRDVEVCVNTVGGLRAEKTVRVFGPGAFRFTNVTYDFFTEFGASVSYEAQGGAPFVITFSDGKQVSSATFEYHYAFQVAPFDTTTYRALSVANACFRTDYPTSGTQSSVVIKPRTRPDGVYAIGKELPPPLCQGDTARFGYRAVGSYAANNEFVIQYRRRGESAWSELVRSKKMEGQLSWVPVAGNFEVLAVSTNPVRSSWVQYLSVYGTPTGILNNNQNVPLTVVRGEPVTLSFVLSGVPPFRLVYTVNNQEVVRTVPGTFNETVIPPAATTVYTLKSVSSGCGSTGAGFGVLRVNTLPVRLSIRSGGFNPNPVYLRFCAGETIEVPYQIEGKPDSATQYGLQIAPKNSDAWRTLATNSINNSFRANLPADLSEGSYQLRVVATNSAYLSMPVEVGINTLPTARLTVNGASSTDVKAGQGVSFNLALSGGEPYTVSLSDGAARLEYFSGYVIPRVYPFRTTTYRIRSVVNECGVGTAPGEVTLRVAPGLVIDRLEGSPCVGSMLTVRTSPFGDIPTRSDWRYELVHQSDNTVVALNQPGPLTSPRQVQLPTSLKPGAYAFRVSSVQAGIEAAADVSIFAPPLVSLQGTTTINAGQTTSLLTTYLNQNGPNDEAVSYELSEGSAGMFRFTQPSALLAVKPAQTTTYRLRRVENRCGPGTGFGSALVTVNPIASQTLSIVRYQNPRNEQTFCTGDSLTVVIETTGVFSPGNQFTIQLSDSLGGIFRSLLTRRLSATSLLAQLPDSLPRGRSYRLRAVASDPGVSVADYALPLAINYKATARFAMSSLVFDPSTRLRARLIFSGDAPWNWRIDGPDATLIASSVQSPDTVSLRLASLRRQFNTFRIRSVANACGPGKLLSPDTLRVEILTAVEPASIHSARVFPNPVTGRLHFRLESAGPYEILLSDLEGHHLLERRGVLPEGEIELHGLPVGIYILRLTQGQKNEVFKILKQ